MEAGFTEPESVIAQVEPSAPPVSLLEISKSEELKVPLTFSKKLENELRVFAGGMAQGLAQTSMERLTQAPGTTALQAGTSFALGYGFVRLAGSSNPALRYALPVLSTALSYSFVANLATDIKDKSETLGTAWQNTWNGKGDLSKERDKVASALGPFLFDTALASVSGLYGARSAAAGLEKKAFYNFMDEKYGKSIRENVFTIAGAPDSSGLRYLGSAFSIDKTRLATAFHVVQDQPGLPWTFFNKSQKGQSQVVAAMPHLDLAILESNKVSFNAALPLAQSVSGTQRGVIVGSPSGKGIEMRVTNMFEGRAVIGGVAKASDAAYPMGGIANSINSGRGLPGMSGGPAISERGEVVGILSTINPHLNLVGIGTASSPVGNLHYMKSVLEKGLKAGGSTTLPEAATKLNMSPGVLLNQIDKGKIGAYLVPDPQNPLQWQWRVVLDK